MAFNRKKPRHRCGRAHRAKLARREAARIAAQQEAVKAQAQSGISHTPGPTPLNGQKAGPRPEIPIQDAQEGPGLRGIGDVDADATKPAATHQEPPLANVALFENQFETRADARLARRAILARWRPKPEHTEAVLTKATVKALENQAKLNEVIAVAKLHLEAHKTIVSDEHHGDRMDYHERALQIRSKVGDYVPGASGPPISINTGGGSAAVSIFLPAKDELQELDRLDQP